MTAQGARATAIVFGLLLMTAIAFTFVVRQHDIGRACRASKQNYDTLVRLVDIPARDPIEHDQLLAVLGSRPEC